MARHLTWICLNDKYMNDWTTPINQFNIEQGLFGIDTVPEGGQTLWPIGDRQVKIDDRYKQKKNGTLLKTYKKLSLSDKTHIFTGKRFKIIRISRGKINGVPENFNKYIMLLERVY